MSKIIVLLLVLVLAAALSMVCTGGNAFSYPKSSKIAMVPNATSNKGGSLYTGTTWPNGDSFTFTNVSVADIANGIITNPITAGGYDTVVLMAMDFDFGAAWNDSDFSSRILSFVNGGGRLIIYTSETTSATAFSNFVYPFTVDTPGQTGSRTGNLTNLMDDTFSSSNPADVPPAIPGAYINLTAITSQTDAVGDLTVMTSYNTNWFIDLFGTNVHGVGGPAHTYAFYGPGLIIFNGLDVDNAAGPPSNANGAAAINMIWWRELCSQTLGAGPNVNGLTLDPATATNLIGTTHNVTATVRNKQTNNPIADVVVNFTITAGPNMGLTSQATTNANGQTTFSWSSSTVGTDTLSATIPNSNPGDPDITTTATKTWIIPGALAVSVSPFLWTMDIGQTELFTATPNGGSGSYTSYQWYVNGSAQSSQIVPTFSFTPVSAGSYLITATVTDNSNTTSPQSTAALVTVNASPTVSITPVGPLTMNAGQKQTFTATPSGGSGTIHYQWYVNAGKVGADNSNYTYTASGSSANVTCEIIDSASTPVTSPLSNTVIITVNPTPTSNSTSTETPPSTPVDSPPSTPTDTPPSTPILPASPTEFLFRFGWVEIAIIIFMLIILVAAVRHAADVCFAKA